MRSLILFSGYGPRPAGRPMSQGLLASLGLVPKPAHRRRPPGLVMAFGPARVPLRLTTPRGLLIAPGLRPAGPPVAHRWLTALGLHPQSVGQFLTPERLESFGLRPRPAGRV
ncbi:MAG: hypothetical protein WCP77_22205 [Roseococcus sp.]